MSCDDELAVAATTFAQIATSRLIGDAAVVLPLVGIANLDVECRKFRQRASSSSPAPIQLQAFDGVVHGSQDVLHHLAGISPLLRAGNSCSTYFCPSASPRRLIGGLGAAFPARLQLLRSAQVAAVESEVFLDKRLAKEHRPGRATAATSGKSSSPTASVAAKLAIDFMHELRLVDVELCSWEASQRQSTGPSRSVGRHFLQVGEAGFVVGVGGIAKRDVVQ